MASKKRLQREEGPPLKPNDEAELEPKLVDCALFPIWTPARGMVRVSRGTRFTGSALVRLLARLDEADVPESKQAFVERLSDWLGWADAISLSSALDGRRATAAEAACSPALLAGSAQGEFTRVRTGLERSIIEEFTLPTRKSESGLRAPPRGMLLDPPTDFAPLRRRYAAKQQAMEVSVGALRARMRELVASASPSLVRLAAVDAVMERVLGEREYALLSTVPALLEKRFERSRKAHLQAQTPTDNASDSGLQPGGWLDVFFKDMRAVLLAELDIRLQPAEGLLEALRTRPPAPHE